MIETDAGRLHRRRDAHRRRQGAARRVPHDAPRHAARARAASVLAQVPSLDPQRVEDVIVGCAMPEYEQGMNVARIGVLLAGLPDSVAGMTINRFCSSGLNAVSIAADRIRTGEADVMIAAGTESMSMIPMLGPPRAQRGRVRARRERRHRLRHGPHRREGRGAVEGLARGAGRVRARVAPEGAGGAGGGRVRRRDHARSPSTKTSPDLAAGTRSSTRRKAVERDEGPRADTSAEGLAKLRPVFAAKGSVTAGNSSQMSDGAGASILVSERVLQRARPRAARALGRLRGRRRAARDHGRRPDRGDSQGARRRPASSRTTSTGSS